MRQVLLLSGPDVGLGLLLASRWAAEGDSVTLVLLDAAAAVARAGHEQGAALRDAAAAGIATAVEEDAARRRAVVPAEGVKVLTLDEITDLVLDGADRVVWL